MPLVRPLAHLFRASPYRGHSPLIFLQAYGEAEPRLTSGGGAAALLASPQAAKPQRY